MDYSSDSESDTESELVTVNRPLCRITTESGVSKFTHHTFYFTFKLGSFGGCLEAYPTFGFSQCQIISQRLV